MFRLRRLFPFKGIDRNPRPGLFQISCKLSEFCGRGPDLLQVENKFQKSKYEVLFGIHPVSVALSANRRTFKTIYYRKDLIKTSERLAEIVETCNKRCIKVKPLSKQNLDTITMGKPHQGVCAEVSKLDFLSFDCSAYNLRNSILVSEHSSVPLWLVLHEIQDPMNFGSVLRTAYFLGVDKVFVSEQNSCSLTPTVSKASAGVMELLRINAVDVANLIETLHSLNWNILGTGCLADSRDIDLPKLVSVESCNISGPAVLIMGNEGSGLPEFILKRCAQLISIPPGRELHPAVDSMNVSAATAIILHSLLATIKRNTK